MFSVSQNLCACGWVFDWAGGLAVAGGAVGVPGLSCANSPPEQARSKANKRRLWILDMNSILSAIAPACHNFHSTAEVQEKIKGQRSRVKK
jgi:hypothetical protein